MGGIDRKLDELKLTARPSTRPAGQARVRSAGLHDVLGGDELAVDDRRCWRILTGFQSLGRDDPASATRGSATLVVPGGPRGAFNLHPNESFVLDIETGGFSGTPVFLIGVVALDSRPLRVEQWLACDYPEEETILRRLAQWAAKRTTWVTFNGKSFDEPFVLERARIHGVSITRPREHLDLLHAARRRWGGRLSNCRLTSLENHILGRARVGDVPGSDAPDLFHHFIRTGNAFPLRAVLEHNQLDLVTSTELLYRLAAD